VLTTWSDDDVAALVDGLARLHDDVRTVLPATARAGRGAPPTPLAATG
jgi:hypothetical protein